MKVSGFTGLKASGVQGGGSLWLLSCFFEGLKVAFSDHRAWRVFRLTQCYLVT